MTCPYILHVPINVIRSMPNRGSCLCRALAWIHREPGCNHCPGTPTTRLRTCSSRSFDRVPACTHAQGSSHPLRACLSLQGHRTAAMQCHRLTVTLVLLGHFDMQSAGPGQLQVLDGLREKDSLRLGHNRGLLTQTGTKTD